MVAQDGPKIVPKTAKIVSKTDKLASKLAPDGPRLFPSRPKRVQDIAIFVNDTSKETQAAQQGHQKVPVRPRLSFSPPSSFFSPFPLLPYVILLFFVLPPLTSLFVLLPPSFLAFPLPVARVSSLIPPPSSLKEG